MSNYKKLLKKCDREWDRFIRRKADELKREARHVIGDMYTKTERAMLEGRTKIKECPSCGGEPTEIDPPTPEGCSRCNNNGVIWV